MEPVAFHSRSALRHAASACCPRNVLIRRWIPGAPYPTWMRGGWRVVGCKPRAVEPWISILLGWSSRVWSSFTFFVQGLVNVLSCGILNITFFCICWRFLLSPATILVMFHSEVYHPLLFKQLNHLKQQWLTWLLKRWVARRSGAASVALMIWGSPAWLGAPRHFASKSHLSHIPHFARKKEVKL